MRTLRSFSFQHTAGTYFTASLIVKTSSNSAPCHPIPLSRIRRIAAPGRTWHRKFEQWLSEWLQMPKEMLNTLPQYDELVLKENKLPTLTSRQTDSVVRTIS